MPFVPFHDYFPKLSEKETRVITIRDDISFQLPSGDYGFLEMYCNEPNCDCRRVFFSVASSRTEKIEAVIAYGWETSNFYAKWMHDNNPKMIAELKGPVLNMGSPQSRWANQILKLTKDVLLKDEAYIRRIQRHYQMFREQVDGHKSAKKKHKRYPGEFKGFQK